ncbi:hypothetical protein AWW66_24465 [Micromonospora rosaria]|uniref:Heavy metal-binding domain-containing protein n=1 Tax=Micromonospora rosaria TaxID=47874 RepID=A0A136PLX1_9ACTN|nr:hypothetical protein [Micromonospora rosaria]KXK59381.1 hypothetical protein AWW66_24465 [Micromonospora rosaria]
MNTATKLTGFALAVVTVFGAAYGVGQVVGPVRPVTGSGHGTDADHGTGPETSASPGTGTGNGRDQADGGTGPAPGSLPAGLLVSDRGYTLAPVEAAAGDFAFRITGPDGRPVTGYDVTHEKPMHLIVVRRDLSGFRHVHPEMSADGTWRTATPLDGPGTWRVFADFVPTGADPLTLGVDVTVPGAVEPRPLPAPARTTTVDGYTVTLDGDLHPGRTSRLTLTVQRGGAPVDDLEPYLGAYGHLVALRQGDLAFLHVHPDGSPGGGRTAAGPAVGFQAEVPSVGTYRLHLDFRHGGVVRTAEFTVVAGTPTAGPTTGPTATGPASPEAGHGAPGHGHN